MDDQTPKLFVTIPEAAAMLSISERGVYRLIHRGDMPSVKIGQARRIRVEDLRNYGRPSDSRSDSRTVAERDIR